MTMKFNDYKEYLSPVLSKATDLVVESAKGCYIKDVNGVEYLDFVQGIAVNAFGHCDERLGTAAKDQIDKIISASFNLVNFEPTLELAKKIAEAAPKGMTSVFFSNGGSEANDGAIKLAKAATGRPVIIAMTGSFHGRSVGSSTITGSNSKYRKHYEPLMGGVYFTPYPQMPLCPAGYDAKQRAEYCLGELKNLLKYLAYPEDVAAIIMEPVQGEGGYVVPDKSFVQGVREICDQHGILLIMDEIQSGYGRTGKMWASEHFDVVPDIMTLGKAIAGGFPMSAVVSTPEIMAKWQPGMHGTTFGGHPVCAAVANKVIDLMKEDNIIENVNVQGEHLQARLKEMMAKYPVMGDVRGLGLMVAVEFVKPGTMEPNADALNFVKDYCLKEEHMLTLSCGVNGNGFRFATPLNIDRATLDLGLDKFEKAVAAYMAQYK